MTIPARAVLAGGSGLIGRRLAAAWLDAGVEVTVLSRSETTSGMPKGIRMERWDGRTVGAWAAALDGVDAIVNLAGANVGEGRWTRRRKRLLRSSRIEPTQALVEAVSALRGRPGIFVQASAVGYYGDRGDETLTEDSAPGTGFLPELCREWESASDGVEALGWRRLVLRTGIVLAREGGALAKMLPVFRLGIAGRLGGGGQWFPWIHLEDAVAAIRFLVERSDLSGPAHLTSPQPVTNAELTRELGRACGRPALLPVPGIALRLLFGDMAEVLLGGQRALPSRLGTAGFHFAYPRLDAALAALLGRSR